MERRESAASARQSGSPGASDQSRIGVLYKEIVKRSKGIIWSPGLLARWSAGPDKKTKETRRQRYGPVL
jgi:hypothetical protein